MPDVVEKKPTPTTAAKHKKQESEPATVPKPETKADKLIVLLKRDSGATLAEITTATGWLPHSARAMLTGLRKKGFTLDKSKVEGINRYAITGEPAA